MRWLLLLLVVLNVFYYVWHQQEAPLRAKDVTPLTLYRGSQQDIRLLSESVNVPGRDEPKNDQCLFLGGYAGSDVAQMLVKRLAEMKIKAQVAQLGVPEPGDWVQVSAEGRALLGDTQLQALSKEFNGLKRKIMQCEGVAPAE